MLKPFIRALTSSSTLCWICKLTNGGSNFSLSVDSQMKATEQYFLVIFYYSYSYSYSYSYYSYYYYYY